MRWQVCAIGLVSRLRLIVRFVFVRGESLRGATPTQTAQFTVAGRRGRSGESAWDPAVFKVSSGPFAAPTIQRRMEMDEPAEAFTGRPADVKQRHVTSVSTRVRHTQSGIGGGRSSANYVSACQTSQCSVHPTARMLLLDALRVKVWFLKKETDAAIAKETKRAYL